MELNDEVFLKAENCLEGTDDTFNDYESEEKKLSKFFPARISLSLDSCSFKFCPKCGLNLISSTISEELTLESIEKHLKDCDIYLAEAKKPFKKKCASCQKVFSSEALLEQHQFFCDPSSTLADFAKNANDDKSKPKVKTKARKRPTVECPICHKTLNQKAYLANHMNTHTGERPHKCSK